MGSRWSPNKLCPCLGICNQLLIVKAKLTTVCTSAMIWLCPDFDFESDLNLNKPLRYALTDDGIPSYIIQWRLCFFVAVAVSFTLRAF